MAALSSDSYDGLIDVVSTYLQRADLDDRIPFFIKQAEVRLRDLVKTMPQQVALPYILTPAAGTNIISLPPDYGAVIRVTYGGKQLQYISPDVLDVENTKRDAMKFTLLGSKLYLQTQSNGSHDLVIYYYQQLESLSETNTSNWLLEDYPNVYIYATLLESEPHVMDDERIQVWSSLLSTALDNAKQAARVAAVPQRTKLVRTRS